MRIVIEDIPHKDQRYDTLGDWYTGPNGLEIRVSRELGSPDARFLVALHELVEAYLCGKAGVTDEMVDRWDMTHVGSDDMEPGDLPGCPYGRQHRFAMLIEHLVAHELGLGNDYGTVT